MLAGPLAPRLFIGLVVLICAEVFSGASIQVGMWAPWTWLVTYWLYFAHFFFFTTLAVRTGRTSLGSLYLWGVLFGLYESWITKVIWHGYGGDGKLVLGHIGPWGFSEISMVVIFHPVASFLLPLAVACVLSPPLRRWFPDLAWITSRCRLARVVQTSLVISFGLTMGLNSGGPIHLLANLAVVLVLLVVLLRLARAGLAAVDPPSLVVVGRMGLVGLIAYLALIYGVGYRFMRWEGLPSIPVQLLTFVFYGLAIGGIWCHRPRHLLPSDTTSGERDELRRIAWLFALVLTLGFGLSFLRQSPALLPAVVVNFAIWTPLGMLLTLASIGSGVRERMGA